MIVCVRSRLKRADFTHLILNRKIDERREVGGREIYIGSFCDERCAAIAGADKDAVDEGRGRELPGEGVLAAAVAEDEDGEGGHGPPERERRKQICTLGKDEMQTRVTFALAPIAGAHERP